MKNIFLLFVIVLSNKLLATQYYISATGVTGNTGLTVGSPKGTLAQVFAAFNLGSGDVINVAAGNYAETGTTVGADDEAFTILGATLSSGVPTSIFTGTNPTSVRFLYFNNVNNDNIAIKQITIKNFYKLTDGGAIFLLSGTDNISFTSVVFDNCDTGGNGGGVFLDGNIVNFTKCTFKNCDATNYGGAIASTNLSTSAATVVVDKCYFYTNSGSYGSAIEMDATSSTMSIINSLFYKNTSSTEGVIGWDHSTVTTMTNCTVVNNLNTDVGGGGVAGIVSWTTGTFTMKNVISYNNTRGDFYEISGTMNLTNCLSTSTSTSTSLLSISGTKTSCITGSPSFTNNATDDYSLTGASNCVNAGNATGTPTDDIRHYSRIGNPDIGCYESNGVALSIELLYFKGILEGEHNKLYWSTASEVNNDYFTIEKSVDGEIFNNIVIINGSGNSHQELYYDFYDEYIYNEINYYILKQTDYDGRCKSSEIISIDNRKIITNITLLKIVDLYGQEVDLNNPIPNEVLLFIYSNGTVIKRFLNKN